jgi:hypothetical protein
MPKDLVDDVKVFVQTLQPINNFKPTDLCKHDLEDRWRKAHLGAQCVVCYEATFGLV